MGYKPTALPGCDFERVEYFLKDPVTVNGDRIILELAFLTVDGLYRAVGYQKRDPHRPQFTDHCFTGDYPTHLTDIAGEPQKQQLSLLAEAS